MNIRFYGDSWFWTWFPTPNPDDGRPDPISNRAFCHSDAMQKFDRYNNSISIMQMLFQNMGHDVLNLAQPGSGFQNTKIAMKHSPLSGQEKPPLNIIFFSSNLRKFLHPSAVKNKFFHPTPGDHYIFDLSSVDRFLESYDRILANDLTEMMLANDHNATYLLIGGQESFPREIFNKVKEDVKGRASEDWYLLSENILVDLADAYNGQYIEDHEEANKACIRGTPRFSLMDSSTLDIHFNPDDPFRQYSKETYVNPEVVEMIASHIDIFESYWGRDEHHYAKRLMVPDTAHLGFSGQVYLVDYIFKFLEDLEAANT